MKKFTFSFKVDFGKHEKDRYLQNFEYYRLVLETVTALILLLDFMRS